MISAGDNLADGGETEVEVAIVGSGPVGVAVATRLMGRVGRIALIEAGGARFRPDESSPFFRAAEISDPRHMSTELYRRRMLGGTTSIWGGRCTPFDPEDFAPAAGRPGWPIPYSEMHAHVGAALDFFDAGRPEYSAAVALPQHPIPLPDAAAANLVIDRIERWSKPTDVWRKFGTELTRSRDVTVIHGATCTNVMTTADGNRATGLEIRTTSGRLHKVLAPTIVLACAGFETPRLLLASRSTRSCGLGNERDLVGRFYMAHLTSDARNAGALIFAKPETARAFDFITMVDGIYGRRMIMLSPELRRRENIPNIVFRLGRPRIDDPSHHNSVLSAMFLARSLLIPAEYMRSLAARPGVPLLEQRAHAANIVADVPKLCAFGVDWLRRRVFATHKLPSVFLYRRDGTYPLEFTAEQTPDPESRVLLGGDTDPFGVPRLAVRWRMRPEEVGGICRAYRELAASVAKSALGFVQLDSDPAAAVQRTLVPQGGVHVGTVRMGADPSTGVVDPNGEVWTTRGLFVIGASTFPTSGSVSVTPTAVALAFRLAEHLVRHHTADPYVAVTRATASSPSPRQEPV